ncbi:MAG: assimilatory sulfite reductase (NADPH) flavoprotein subunit [Verrucomicrobia bacterium]|jgi:sulfite reductase (NADPH) flavoprotein alpha-component|nr:assimilatory sulfite reductase (NADPH) flavoprotein subunit [Verrucomicrobiota bacterium]
MSESTVNLPGNAPFGHQQRVALDALIPTLNAQQASWLSGYFAGVAQTGATNGNGAAAPAPAPAAAPAAPKVPLTILFGSESGNAEECAAEAGKEAKKAGFQPSVVDMGDYDFGKLPEEKNVLVVVSTWGEGDPPERATAFHEQLMGGEAPSLNGLHFSVCALGDTSYPDFCECGKQMDRRFGELGGVRIADRVDCDVDFEEPFQQWLQTALPRMVDVAGVKEAAAAPSPQVQVMEPVPAGNGAVPPEGPQVAMPESDAVTYGKKNPFPAKLKERILLNGRGSSKETVHLELSLEGSGMSYEPGDVVGVFPSNSPEVADDFLRVAGFRGDELIDNGNGRLPSLREELIEHHDITSVNPSILKKYAPLAKNKQLDKLLEPENKEELNHWLECRELRDLFYDFPARDPLTMDQVLGILRKMPPRLYSIASSFRAHPDEVHLTVAAVRYECNGRSLQGVCSTYLCDRVDPGDSVPIYTHHNKNFFLPEDPDTPIIMVGPGTGIAPFRAFVEERDELGSKGKNWLFFGDQHFATDFLYQAEWQKYLKRGLLARMDVAFSRDTDHKVYVQHRMKEQAKELYAWLQDGAYFYVCGDATHMAKDVHQALIEIHQEQGGLSEDDATAAVKQLQKDKRYQRDVY